MIRSLPAVLFALFFTSAYFAPGQPLDSTMWVTDQPASAIVRSGNAVYVAGNFYYTGPHTGGGGVVNLTNGKLTSYDRVPNVNGQVHTALPDGKGGWFIGGAFTHVQGVRRYNLAHILPDNTLDAAWSPNVGSDSTDSEAVHTMAVADGMLYIGGTFTRAGGQVRSGLASIQVTTGQVSDWHPAVHYLTEHSVPDAPGSVQQIAIRNNILYLGGKFNRVANQTRNHLAAIDISTELPTHWNPDVNGVVNAFVLGTDRMYLGGKFGQVGAQYVNNIAGVDLLNGHPVAWNPSIDGEVYALAMHHNTVYAGGYFRSVAGRNSPCLAAIDASTGQLTPWNPDLTGEYVKTIAVAGNAVYIGGVFSQAGGKVRVNLAALDVTTAQATLWAPVANALDRSGSLKNYVNVIATGSGNMYVGGTFFILGGERVQQLAAFDANTGRPLPWKVNVLGTVRAMALVGNHLYLGAEVGSVNGQSREGLAAVDIYTGKVTPFNPTWNRYLYPHVNKMVAAGDKIYMSSHFGNHIGIIDLTTGTVTDWELKAIPKIVDFTIVDDRIYVVGGHGGINDPAVKNLVCYNLSDHQLNPWNPFAGFSYSPELRSVAVSGDKVIVGGTFGSIHGQERSHLAAFDKNTARLLPWSPVVERPVQGGWDGIYTMSVDNGKLYVGGYFDRIDGLPRNTIAEIDLDQETVTDWKVEAMHPYVYPYVITPHAGTVYLGGFFTSVSGRSGFGAFGRTLKPVNYIKGKIYDDKRRDCAQTSEEKGLPNLVVTAEPGPYFGITDSLGAYTIAVDTGTYTVRQVLSEEQGRLITQTCPASPATHTVAFQGYNHTVAGKDFGNQVTLRPYLTATVGSTRRRRCFPGNTTLSYCNEGNLPATDAKVHLELPPHVVLVSAGAPYTVAPDKHYVFDVGTLAPNGCGTIQITDSVVCNNPDIRGLTQCTKVWITPANRTAPEAGWDGSDITLKATCISNGRVRLGLYNTGTAAMSDSSAYRIYLDAKLVLSRNYQLAAGDSLMLQVPANGQTVRLEADQRPGHPAKQSTNVSIEGCGTNTNGKVSLGFVAQLPPDDAEPEVDTECLPITDSFDPNDKLVLPAGVTAEHYTAFGQELEYTVRFQNTGNDYAYRVVIVDTLSNQLDLSTLRVVGASHPYRFAVSGKGRPVLTFTFDNINLPDSTRDQAGSNGLVKFTIKPLKDLPEKTRIENFADIFFDYNPPVRTNTTLNTLYDLPLETGGDALPVTVCAANPPVSAGANQAFCGNQSTVLQAQNPVHGQGRWKRVSGAGRIEQPHDPHTAVSGLGTGDNVFEWTIADGSCATDSLRSRVTITRYPNPETPVIAFLGVNELQSSVEGDAYQWHCNGRLLPGNARRIEADQAGTYTVQVANGRCYSGLSAPFEFRLTSPALRLLSRIYPNPADREFTVALPAGVVQLHLTVFDVQGRKVAESTAYNPGKAPLLRELDLIGCRAGVYLVKIQTEAALVVRRVVLR